MHVFGHAKANKQRRSKKSKGNVNDHHATENDEKQPVADEPYYEPDVDGTSLPHGYVYPPNWVKSGNVYSNVYRRLKASGCAIEEVRERAKEARRAFSQHGGVPADLVASFGLIHARRRQVDMDEEPGWFANQDANLDFGVDPNEG